MTTFDLTTFLSLPRLSGLALSRDGGRLVVGVAEPAPDGRSFRSALWELDPAGANDARKLTRSRKGETSAAFAPDGTLWFTSARPDPDAEKEDGEPRPALWSLPATGEPRLLAAPGAGVAGFAVAQDSGDVVVLADVFPGADDLEADRERASTRDDAGVKAQLFDDFPIRYWDHWLGPREPGVWAAAPADDGTLDLRLVARGHDFLHGGQAVPTPDGTRLVAVRRRPGRRDPRERVSDLVTIDVATGEVATLVADDGWYGSPCVSPDGTRVVAVREDPGDPDRPVAMSVVLVDLASGTTRAVAPGLDVWPAGFAWLPDSDGIVVGTDETGHHPLYRIDLGPSGSEDHVTRLTAEGSYTDVCVAPDGETLYALRSTLARPPHPVRLSSVEPDQLGEELPSPAAGVVGPGRVERVTATADDGVEIGSWLVLPPDASGDAPAPLVTFIHGGPLGSWNAWHWRWNPHVLVEHGYAVLCPDPGLSTGYGDEFLARGWGAWGDEPYTDVMRAVDGAIARDDVDSERIAAMGGSFGGYMANWVASHTDRFKAIVTHASLWALRGFHGATDVGHWWEFQFGDPYSDPWRYEKHSPDAHVGDISTPMLVIHGELDYRVPIGEALQLWTDLSLHGVDAKFLYYPDENHWVLKPQNARLWYETVLAFLDHHVLDEPWERPDLV